LGLAAKSGKLSNLGRGFLLGFASLACVAALEILKRGRVFIGVVSLHGLLKHFVSAALTAVIVAVLEEFIFRGTLFGILRKVWRWPKALLLSSAVYALVHFIKKTNFVGPVQAWSGLELLPRMFQLGPTGVPMFLALFLAGSILALAYQRTGTLFFSMGLHAGWIFWLKFYGLVGNGNPRENWWTLPVLGVVFLLVWKMKPVEEANGR
jgi:membrane protease YdiL (CAAX protease family)